MPASTSTVTPHADLQGGGALAVGVPQLEAMGRELDRRWRAVSFEEAMFAELAEEALMEFAPWEAARPMDAVRWVHEQVVFPTQLMRDQSFGQPPITVFQGEGFVVDVLFWVDATTSIHQHAFSGAFAVFAGSSIHSRYTFEFGQRINAHARVGSISLGQVERLGRGDVRQIAAGERFIHSLFHLERPSVSIVVRTRNDARAGPQFDYVRPSLSFDPFYSTPHLDKKRQTLTLLRRIEAPEYEDVLLSAVARADLLEGFLLLDRADGHSISEEGWELTQRALDVMRKRHGDSVDTVAAAIRERRRIAKLSHWRRRVVDPEHRFFLALLLNVPNRRDILALVRERVPDRDPIDTTMEWIRVLTRASGPGRAPLGVQLGEGAMNVLRRCLEGDDVDATARALEQDYAPGFLAGQADGGDVHGEIERLHREFRRSDFFAPLVASPASEAGVGAGLEADR